MTTTNTNTTTNTDEKIGLVGWVVGLTGLTLFGAVVGGIVIGGNCFAFATVGERYEGSLRGQICRTIGVKEFQLTAPVVDHVQNNIETLTK
jgi:hypothetical protein